MKRITEAMVKELKQLEDRAGRINPSSVIELAQSPESAVHEWFTWDDRQAAIKCRIDEARELIRAVRLEVVIEDRSFPAVLYVRDPARAGNEEGYQSLPRVRTERVLDVVIQELDRIGALFHRLNGIVRAREADVPPDVAKGVARAEAQVIRLVERCRNTELAEM